jgi:hypothetical protein
VRRRNARKDSGQDFEVVEVEGVCGAFWEEAEYSISSMRGERGRVEKSGVRGDKIINKGTLGNMMDDRVLQQLLKYHKRI